MAFCARPRSKMSVGPALCQKAVMRLQMSKKLRLIASLWAGGRMPQGLSCNLPKLFCSRYWIRAIIYPVAWMFRPFDITQFNCVPQRRMPISIRAVASVLGGLEKILPNGLQHMAHNYINVHSSLDAAGGWRNFVKLLTTMAHHGSGYIIDMHSGLGAAGAWRRPSKMVCSTWRPPHSLLPPPGTASGADPNNDHISLLDHILTLGPGHLTGRVGGRNFAGPAQDEALQNENFKAVASL